MKPLEEEAKKYAEIGSVIDPAYANGLFYGFTAGACSQWVKAEKIKAQLEAVRAVDTYGLSHMINHYEQELKKLEDENNSGKESSRA